MSFLERECQSSFHQSERQQSYRERLGQKSFQDWVDQSSFQGLAHHQLQKWIWSAQFLRCRQALEIRLETLREGGRVCG